ncbi:MAG TPA: hypothetical protein PK856_01930 [Vitreoscilla sp.]|nr:hypothetical protein [Vitreoscilla sp.]
MSASSPLNASPSWALLATITLALLATGHINQLAHYHDFADQTHWLMLPNGKDVWSNMGLILIGLWACYGLKRAHIPFTGRISAYVLASAIVLTGLGSSYYHLQPNDFSLIWDRLPISLICAGLLGMVFQYTHQRSDGIVLSIAIIFAVLGVWYWHVSGDLRLYLGMQVFTILALPLWLWQARAPRAITLALLWAIGFYIASKVTEALDVQLFALSSHIISGHTLKHLFATMAMACVVVAMRAMVLTPISASGVRCLNRKFG